MSFIHLGRTDNTKSQYQFDKCSIPQMVAIRPSICYSTHYKSGGYNMKITNVCGDTSRAAYLIQGTQNILFDAGMAYSADNMIENIRRELSGEKLDAVLLSHSHYDHVSGVPFLRKVWPDVIVYGSEYAKHIMEKPSAKALMRHLSDSAAVGAGMTAAPDYDEDALKIDCAVADGAVLKFGDLTVKVFATPGHTKCCVSYLINDVIFASETIGVTTRGCYMPCYLVGYEMAVESTKKLKDCGAKKIFMTHRGILDVEEEQISEFWRNILGNLECTKNEIIEIIRTWPDEESCINAMVQAYHADVSEEEQPEEAFRLNAAATLKVIEREFANECSAR